MISAVETSSNKLSNSILKMQQTTIVNTNTSLTDIFGVSEKNKEIIKDKSVPCYTSNIRDMMARVQSEPKMKMIYSGIKENSVGFIFGPSKSAKTIFCENLGFSIASGATSFLDIPLNIENRKVLFLSLEEFYAGRTERNATQLSKLLSSGKGDTWLDNYIVVNENMPRYISTDEEWDILKKVITENKPGVVFIDSLSRLYEGSIEESKVAKDVMRRLRELSNDTKTTIIVIHHTHKLSNTPLTINTIAGSRIIAQDADFMIGMNKTLDGKRYLKNVAFRYCNDDFEKVKVFTIENDCWLNITGEEEEAKLLAAYDGRVSDLNRDKILNFISINTSTEKDFIETKELETSLVKTGELSKQTLHTQLKQLVEDKKIFKITKGKYKVAA
jgi:hypothetical protein